MLQARSVRMEVRAGEIVVQPGDLLVDFTREIQLVDQAAKRVQLADLVLFAKKHTTMVGEREGQFLHSREVNWSRKFPKIRIAKRLQLDDVLQALGGKSWKLVLAQIPRRDDRS